MTIEELYQANYRVVYGYLFSLCGERALAEDLAAETFLRAMEHPGSFDDSAKPSTWLCAIGKNLYLNECRRRKRKRRALEQLAEPPRAAQSLEETVALREDAWRVLEGGRRACRNCSGRWCACAFRACGFRRSRPVWARGKAGRG